MTATSDPLSGSLRGLVGDKTARALAKGLDLHTVGDLLDHLPRRYDERGQLTDLSAMQVDQDVTILARIVSVDSRPMRNRRGHLLEVVVTDGQRRVRLSFFNQGWREKHFVVGGSGMFSGRVGVFRGQLQLTHPECILFDIDTAVELRAEAAAEQEVDVLSTFPNALIPVYPATAGLASWRITKCVQLALNSFPDLPDPLPRSVRANRRLAGLIDAYRLVHQPETRDDVRRGLERLRYDEAFVLQVVLARRRMDTRALHAVPRVARDGGLLDAFDERLPFTLTAGQRDVSTQITEDLAADRPMHRLLQGEVGSGKTVVALRAMLTTVDAGGQAALLAPTEVLAQQHHRSIEALLGSLAHRGRLGGDDRGTRVVLLTGSQSAAARRQALLDIVSGEAGIVVGTHALLQENVDFLDLGLVVVDEQHRFGVEQRDTLRAKSLLPPHVLVMTATPIPRTVAMTVFGDLEISTLTELPAGRPTITTHVVPLAEKPQYRQRVWERIREEVAQRHQAYVVCPRIGSTDTATDDGSATFATAGVRPSVTVLDLYDELATGPLDGLRVGMLHGRMPTDDKDAAMQGFAAGRIDVLVATTVIEVGVDVPNASTMVVMDAERFGVSQLHQLRGRVGRGAAPGLCLLVSEAAGGSPARQRLDAVAQTQDGFELSRLDLDQRREGDVLGTAQAGERSSLRVLRVLRDEETIIRAREDAIAVVAEDPDLLEHPALREATRRLIDEEQAEFLEKT